MLRGFSLSPPPPENLALLYGFLPPNYCLPKHVLTLIPKALDKHATYHFSLTASRTPVHRQHQHPHQQAYP